ncbi:TRAP transporter substrate-binding protein [Orrella sp. JC864]|uniref:TRAP transporter substrate-binding protein n=1 Tax=Orrella sp. JC864 TaxID=3120298 RepID=UPI00300BB11C
MSNTSRRHFLAAAGMAAAAPFFPALVRPAHAAVTLTLGHGAAPGNPRAVAAEKFAELVAAKTQGAVRVNIAGAEQLGSDAAMLTSLRTGALDFSINSQGPVGNLVPEINALGLPFLFQTADQATQVLEGDVGQELAQRMEPAGMTLLSWWDNGIRHVTNSKRAVQTPADLKGLKLRVPSDVMLMDIFKALGASTEQIAFGELYIALQQGVVDGQENPLANIESSKLYEVNRYISLTGHVWQSNPFLMSRIARAKVGAPELQAIGQAAQEAGALQRQLMREADTQLLAKYRADTSLHVNEVDPAPFREATAPVVQAWRNRKGVGQFVSRLVDAASA